METSRILGSKIWSPVPILLIYMKYNSKNIKFKFKSNEEKTINDC